MDNDNLKDHKQIGQELELFFTNDYAPGAPFWMPKGMVIFKQLEKYIRELTEQAGYLETSTPIMIDSRLFIESGHFAKFGESNMYNLPIYDTDEIEYLKQQITNSEIQKKIKEKLEANNYQRIEFEVNISPNKKAILIVDAFENAPGFSWNLAYNFTLKPMNCPESTIIYRFRPRSYKELPLRLSEIGRLHRKEKGGEVNGLLRVRQLTMDDAHIYASENQIFSEVSNILDMMIEFYTKFGFEFDFRLATRPELYAGTEENWKKAEKDLEDALKKKKLKYSLKPQDGAFYGPKIDVHIKDSLQREWQLATVQLDFHMPQAFDLKYVNNKGEFEKPVMIHRAILGSFERYIGILTEHFQGNFPLWLNPVQIALLPISEDQHVYSKKIQKKLEKRGIRAIVNLNKDPLGAKIQDATLQKVSYLGIIGSREMEENSISLRSRNGEDLGKMKISSLIQKLKKEIDKKI